MEALPAVDRGRISYNCDQPDFPKATLKSTGGHGVNGGWTPRRTGRHVDREGRVSWRGSAAGASEIVVGVSVQDSICVLLDIIANFPYHTAKS